MMHPATYKFPALAFIALVIAAPPMSRPVDEPEVTCGNEYQRACTSSNWEYWAQFAYTGRSRACEFDLAERGGVCLNARRRTIRNSSGWAAWALGEQRYGIGRDVPVNQAATVGTHNSFSNAAQGYWNPITRNQALSLTDQLQGGVRSLELDVSFYGGHLRLCHGKRWQGCAVPGFSGSRLAADALIEIRNWLGEHKPEVVILKIDDDLDGGTELSAAASRYLEPFIFKNLPLGRAWPTMAEIQESGKQILVVVQTTSRIAPDAWVWKGLDYVSVRDWMSRAAHETRTGLIEVAEGQAVSNAIGAPTGLLSVQNIRKVSDAGVGLIGLDYLNGESDSRLQASIWSFTEGDYGLNGPALLNVATGRWESASPGQSRPLACASDEPAKRWRVTRHAYAWSTTRNNGCQLEFGNQYRFAFPASGGENQKLKREAQVQGARAVWLAYARRSEANDVH
jgi:hypothetical protein